MDTVFLFAGFPVKSLLRSSFFFILLLTHSDSTTLGALDQQGGERWVVNWLFQFVWCLTLSQRPHWSVRKRITYVKHSSPLPQATNSTVRSLSTHLLLLIWNFYFYQSRGTKTDRKTNRHTSRPALTPHTAAGSQLATWKAWKICK